VKVAISQPAYLPWLGYFDLIDQADTFVLLDSAQFEKQSWQHRNRIKTPTGLQWLTVPVLFRGRFGQRIQDVEIRDPDFFRQHLRAVELNYRRSPFFEQFFPEFSEMLQRCSGSPLVELNQTLILWFCRILGIRSRIVRSSDLDEKGKRCELLINLCRRLQSRSYLSPLGSAVYLLNDLNKFAEAGIEVEFQHYEHPVYRQLFGPFQSHASALDLIFNEGDAAMAIVRSGRRAAFKPEEAACSAGMEEHSVEENAH
jgi:WbqC-like protein family